MAGNSATTMAKKPLINEWNWGTYKLRWCRVVLTALFTITQWKWNRKITQFYDYFSSRVSLSSACNADSAFELALSSRAQSSRISFHFNFDFKLSQMRRYHSLCSAQDHVQFSYASFSSAYFIIMISSRIKCPTFASCAYCVSDAVGLAWPLYDADDAGGDNVMLSRWGDAVMGGILWTCIS